jgi:hypothetical protein
MRFSTLALSLCAASLLLVCPCVAAVRPSVAQVETLPVGNGGSILINIEEDGYAEVTENGNVKPYGVTLPNGGAATLRKLKLTLGEAREPLPAADLRIEQGTVPVPVFFRNLTRYKLRVTLQQPKAPTDATAKVKATYCAPTCKLDPEVYGPLCTGDSHSLTRCRPNLTALAICGTEECNAIRKACDGPDCTVDLYKALDACACSVTRTLAPSTFPREPELRSARYVETATGYALQNPTKVADARLRELAESIGVRELPFQKISAQQTLSDHPTVLFDAGLFVRKDGLTTEGADVFRFLIEQDPAAPVQGTVLQQDRNQKDPPPADYAQGMPPIAVITAPTANLISNNETGQPMRVVVVPLDDTGVANWRYLNPRSPACINCGPGGAPLRATDLPAGVVFRNRTQDRTFLITLTLPANIATNAIEEAFRCTPGQPCKITRSVAPQNTVLFDASILALFKNSLIRFDVSLYGETATVGNAAAYLSLNNPFDENTKLNERPSSVGFKTKLSLSGRVDPQIPAVPTAADVTTGADNAVKAVDTDPANPLNADQKAEIVKTFLAKTLCFDVAKVADYKPDNEPQICADRPYVDGNTQAYRGLGSINLAANLSDRADASVTLSFRDGNYGAAEIDKTAVSEYNVTIYGLNGLSLKFGKADFLIPSNGIAIAESGEGFLYSFRNFGLGHVIRRESDAGTPLQTNQDKKDWFLQARSLSIAQRWREQIALSDSQKAAGITPTTELNAMARMLSVFRSADLFVVRGEDKKTNVTYTTAGGEIFFARPGRATPHAEKGATRLTHIFSGSFAAYQARRHVDEENEPATGVPTPPCVANTTPTPSPACTGRGSVWLFTLNWTPSMVIAGGTNTATTPHTVSLAIGQGTGNKPGTPRDEGYIGDPAAFAPDRLFLRTFVKSMNSKNVPYAPLGLSNKRYTAITYTNSEVSLFDLVASALRVADDVNSRSTIISAREYKLRYAENGARGAAREYNVIFNIEVPKGVTFSFDASYLEPSEAFKDRITDRAWAFGANVTLSL